jgi:hypothetical protein
VHPLAWLRLCRGGGNVYNFGLAESDPLPESAELLLTILAMAHEQWDSYVRDGKTLEAAVIDRFVTSVRCRFDPVAPLPYDDELNLS